MDSVESTQSSNGCCNVIHTADTDSPQQPGNQLYAAVSKPGRFRSGAIQSTDVESRPDSSDGLYAAVNKARRPNPGLSRRGNDPTDDSPNEITNDISAATANKPLHSCSNPAWYSHQPSVTSQLEDGDYNSLDLGGRRCLVGRRRRGGGGGGGGGGGVTCTVVSTKGMVTLTVR